MSWKKEIFHIEEEDMPVFVYQKEYRIHPEWVMTRRVWEDGTPIDTFLFHLAQCGERWYSCGRHKCLHQPPEEVLMHVKFSESFWERGGPYRVSDV